MKKIIAISLLALCASAYASAEIKEVTYTLAPRMHCAKCEARVKDRLKFERGIKGLEISSKTNTVKVKYDDKKNSPAKFESELAKIGFKATPVTSEASNDK